MTSKDIGGRWARWRDSGGRYKRPSKLARKAKCQAWSRKFEIWNRNPEMQNEKSKNRPEPPRQRYPSRHHSRPRHSGSNPQTLVVWHIMCCNGYGCRGGSGLFFQIRFSHFWFQFRNQVFSNPAQHFGHFANIDGHLSSPALYPILALVASATLVVISQQWAKLFWQISTFCLVFFLMFPSDILILLLCAVIMSWIQTSYHNCDNQAANAIEC